MGMIAGIVGVSEEKNPKRDKTMTTDCQTTHLYRHFDAEGKLLYVGISYNAIARIKQHTRAEKPWIDDIANMTIETFDTREDALDAEKKAIIEEKPVHNVVHNGCAMLSPMAVQPREADWVGDYKRFSRTLKDIHADLRKDAEFHYKHMAALKANDTKAGFRLVAVLWVLSIAAAVYFF